MVDVFHCFRYQIEDGRKFFVEATQFKHQPVIDGVEFVAVASNRGRKEFLRQKVLDAHRINRGHVQVRHRRFRQGWFEMKVDEAVWELKLLILHVEAFAEIVHQRSVRLIVRWGGEDVEVPTNETIGTRQWEFFSYPSFVPQLNEFWWKVWKKLWNFNLDF